MKNDFKSLVAKLQSIATVFDTPSTNEKILLLQSIAKLPYGKPDQLVQYHEVLLFMAAHPDSAVVLQVIGKELHRISGITRKCKAEGKDDFEDSGLPFSTIATRLSHDMMVWLAVHKECSVELDTFGKPKIDINTLLSFTLPPLERDETTAGSEQDDLFETLNVKEENRLEFLLDQFGALNTTPFIKDQLWEQFDLFFQIRFNHILFSRSYNRVDTRTYFQSEILKKFDHKALIASPLPDAGRVEEERRNHVADVIKKSLVLTMRETDPSTYMDESSLRYFELERGISIAIYGMTGLRQLPLQSYVGFTAFKNGYPVAYGGSWIFGKAATFGINIFEAYRGGESGYVMCQLLRVYSQAFGLTYIEVEPYQFGLDNPDGIKSGAFWFYYRFGFRSVSKELDAIATKEMEKIKSKPGYRTSEKTLIHFTEDYIALQLGSAIPIKYNDAASAVKRMITKDFKGLRSAAKEECRKAFLQRVTFDQLLTQAQDEALTDLAMMARAMKIESSAQFQILKDMVVMKSEDPYEYNNFLVELLP
jgi:hypothetical protein